MRRLRRADARCYPLLVLLSTLAVCLPAPPACAQLVWELTPYRCHMLLAIDQSPELAPPLADELAAEVVRRSDAFIGGAWNLTAAAAPPALERKLLRPAAMALEIADLPPETLAHDKVFLVTIARAAPGYRVVAQDFDTRTQTFSSPVSLSAGHAAKLADTAFRAVYQAFAPLAQVSEVENKTVKLRLRGGRLAPRDAALAPIAPGKVFLPIVRYNDREGKPRRITPVPWTYLTVTAATDATLTCQLASGMRTPLSGRRRGRTEQLALAVVPPHRPTVLTLRSRTDPAQVLAGYDIYQQGDEPQELTLLGRTDRVGRFTIAPEGTHVRTLLVKSGNTALARLPVMPGLPAELSAEIANDDRRLEVEGYIVGMQQDLVDLVTRREVLLARATARLEAKQYAEAEKLIEELQALRTREEFDRELVQQQGRIVADDPNVQRKIDRMFDTTRKLLRQYLDPEPVEKLVVRLSSVRTASSAEAPSG